MPGLLHVFQRKSQDVFGKQELFVALAQNCPCLYRIQLPYAGKILSHAHDSLRCLLYFDGVKLPPAQDEKVYLLLV